MSTWHLPSPSSIPARAQPSYDDEDDGPQFVLALLTDGGKYGSGHAFDHHWCRIVSASNALRQLGNGR